MIWNFKKPVGLIVTGIAAAAFASGALAQPDYPPVTVDMTPTEVTKNVWMFQGQTGVASQENQGYMSNAGVVITSEGVVLFDALGTPSLGAQLSREIKKLTDKSVVQLVVSHYHSDHFYGLPAFAHQRVPIVAHRAVFDYLKTEAPLKRLQERRVRLKPWVNEKSRIKPPDVALDGDKSFKVGNVSFRIIHAGPAHTAEDLMLFAVEPGVLFAGDLVFSGRLPWVGNADTRGWLAALEKVMALKPAYLVPGHGKVSRYAASDLKLTYEYLAFLREKMGQGVEDLMEFDEAYEQVDWQRFKKVPLFDQVNRRNAYNTYLGMQRESLGK